MKNKQKWSVLLRTQPKHKQPLCIYKRTPDETTSCRPSKLKNNTLNLNFKAKSLKLISKK